MNLRQELAALLEERTLSHFERRKRRVARIPWSVRVSAPKKSREGDQRVPREEWIVLHRGWVPEERKQLIQFFESKGDKRRPNCGSRCRV